MNRLGFIGGSDARRIMEGDWHDLWLEKTSRSESADLSDVLPVQLGTFTEDFNIQWFSKNQLNDECHIEKQGEYIQTIDGVPCKGTVDGFIFDKAAILECKHTYDRNSMESCIKQYMPQIQFYLMLSKADGCYLSVIFGNRRWECVYISYDQSYIDNMMVHISEFWKHVADDVEPFGKQPKSLSTDNILVDNMTRRDASGDNEFISRVHDYIEQASNAKAFESAKADLKAMVDSNEREVYCDLLSIKRDKRGALRITIKENNDG